MAHQLTIDAPPHEQPRERRPIYPTCQHLAGEECSCGYP
jgi:hypothetical protein